MLYFVTPTELSAQCGRQTIVSSHGEVQKATQAASSWTGLTSSPAEQRKRLLTAL